MMLIQLLYKYPKGCKVHMQLDHVEVKKSIKTLKVEKEWW